MASVAFAFGSFGDIISAITVICKLTKSLREGNFSGNAEYDELMVELAALECVLIELIQLVVTLGSPLQNSQASLNALCVAVNKCCMVIQEFKDSTQGNASADSSSLWNLWRVTSWVMSKRQAAVMLRAELMRQQVAITVILSMATCAHNAQSSSRESIGQLDVSTASTYSAAAPVQGVPEGTLQPNAIEWQQHQPPPLSPIDDVFGNSHSLPSNSPYVSQEEVDENHYLSVSSPPRGHAIRTTPLPRSTHIITPDDKDSDSFSDTDTDDSHTIHSPLPTPPWARPLGIKEPTSPWRRTRRELTKNEALFQASEERPVATELPPPRREETYV